jgi:hypothetical protein
MRSQKRGMVLLLAILVIVVTTAMAALRGQDQNNSSQDETQVADQSEFENQYPIADYSTPESTDAEKRAKRRVKAKRLFKPNLTVHENAGVTAGTDSQVALLDSLTAAAGKSKAVVIGQIISAQAYLNSDKSNIYSEFTVRVEGVLKDDSYAPLIIGNPVVAARNGGRIRYPSGRVTIFFTAGEGMPRLGRRYVLFLSRDEHERDYDIVTGYELRAGHIALLDNPGPDHPLTDYKGTDEIGFLGKVRDAISNSSHGMPEERRQ